jgi:hypothetical protein
MNTQSFEQVKIGDIVYRNLAGTIMNLEVTNVDDTLIYTKGGWTFDRKTGMEEDELLGWGVQFGITGSYLVNDTL